MFQNNLLQRRPQNLLKEFLILYNEVYPIDIIKANKLIQENISHLNGKIEKPSYVKELENRWYESLKTSKADFSIYDDYYYFTDLWACFHKFSRRYLLSILKNNSLNKTTSIYEIFKDIKSIIDLGCGIGYTTAIFKQLFPNADVCGTNLEDTKQYKFCQKMSSLYNFKIVSDIKQAKPVDLVFASEYFEHIYNPIDHILDVINILKPKFLFLANSFNTVSVGHFEYYAFQNGAIKSFYNQNEISRKFNRILVSNGYTKIKTKLWNNKPTLWAKNEPSIPFIHSI